MMLLRLDEIGLILVPFALFIVWRFLGPRTPPWMVWTASAAIVMLSGATVWLGLHQHLPQNEQYQPAQLENGQIVEGHGVPKP